MVFLTTKVGKNDQNANAPKTVINQRFSGHRDGAGDRARTGTGSLPLDFKSKASANSAMPPYPFSIAKGMKKVNWEIAIRGANGLPRLTQYS